MKIQVTKEHINQGVARQWTSCPVALAIRSHIPGLVSVGPYNAYLVGLAPIGLPTTVIQFIDDFDMNRLVEPFEFELAVPEEGTK